MFYKTTIKTYILTIAFTIGIFGASAVGYQENNADGFGTYTIFYDYENFPTCVDDVDALPIYLVFSTDSAGVTTRGSGFLIHDNLWAVASHVVSANQVTTMLRINGNNHLATIVYNDANHDITLVRTTGIMLEPMLFSTDIPSLDEPVWNMGFPSWAGLSPVISNGVVINNSAPDEFYSDAIVMVGMSGGATFACYDNIPTAIGTITGFTEIITNVTHMIVDGVKVETITSVNSGRSLTSSFEHIREYVGTLQ